MTLTARIINRRSLENAPRPVSSEELLWQWCRNGWAYRKSHSAAYLGNAATSARYVNQLRHEMGIIIAQDYVDYFLLVSDIVRYAKDSGIPVGPGRGSSAASLVCWLLRITEVDPMLYPLMDFSRFIVPGREDLPDIDIDFDDERRHEVREYAVQRYGADRVGNIGTFTKYKGKNSIDDVARVYSLPKADCEALKSMIVERSGGDSRADAALTDTLAMFPEAEAIMRKHPALKFAMDLEGNYRGMSVHSAGLVITSMPIADICAQYTRAAPGDAGKRGETLTSVAVDKYSAEYLQLMKIDLLGLSTMGMIRIALAEAGMKLEELYSLPMDDGPTLDAFRRNDVVGIFQFEGRATRLVGRDLRPDDFLELVDTNGLSRPGPLFSGTTAEYIDVKHGRKPMPRIHPVIDEITAGTKGNIIYQEQILRALRLFGGLEAKKVHDIRRIISQKLGEAQFNASYEAFAEGAARLHGKEGARLAAEVWGRVVTSASYAFVYAHSLAYAMIGYWCQWLKVHYPAAFYAAQLRKTDEKRWPRLIRDAEAHGVTVRGVTPGLSSHTWSVANAELPDSGRRAIDNHDSHDDHRSHRHSAGDARHAVVAGYLQLPGIGPTKAQAIAEYVADHEVNCAEDLLAVRGIGPAMVSKLRESLESDDPFGLQAVGRAINAVREAIASGELPMRGATAKSDDILDIPGGKPLVWLGLVKLKEYKDFVEDERARSGRSVDDIRRDMRRPDLPTSCVLHCYDDGDEDVYVRITRFDYPKFRRAIERITLNKDVVWVRARKSNGGFGASIYVEDLAVIEPD